MTATTVTLLADQVLDTEKLMLDGIDTSAKPLYSVSEMAGFFFARSPHWVRWLEACHYTTPVLNKKTGKTKQVPCLISTVAHSKKMREAHQSTWKFMLDGELLLPLRTEANARKYDLALVEKIAHALASHGTIKTSQLRQALMLVKIQAEMYEYL